MMASKEGHVEVVEKLLNYGVAIDLRNKFAHRA